MLAPARASLAAANVAFDAVKRVGEPADEIIHCASERGVDLIVMGTHGRTALANLVVGSVATKVLAQASTPVLLLH
jgi:nucleotide-binding universal stress UspA family protein